MRIRRPTAATVPAFDREGAIDDGVLSLRALCERDRSLVVHNVLLCRVSRHKVCRASATPPLTLPQDQEKGEKHVTAPDLKEVCWAVRTLWCYRGACSAVPGVVRPVAIGTAVSWSWNQTLWFDYVPVTMRDHVGSPSPASLLA